MGNPRSDLNEYIEQHTEALSANGPELNAVEMGYCKVRIKSHPSADVLMQLVDAREPDASQNPLRGGQWSHHEISGFLDSEPQFALRFMALASQLGVARIDAPITEHGESAIRATGRGDVTMTGTMPHYHPEFGHEEGGKIIRVDAIVFRRG